MVIPEKDSWIRRFIKEPFETVDSVSLMIKGNELNFFRKDRRLRLSALGCGLVCLALWAILGFDSTPLQFIHALYEMPVWITGQASFGHVIDTYHLYYGKEMHYSAFVIYGFMYYYLSRHFTKFDIRKSRNIVFTAGFVFLAICTFEFFWINSFAHFQRQPWVAKWAMPQFRILFQNLYMLVIGVPIVFYVWVESYVYDKKGEFAGRRYFLNWGLLTWALISLTAISALTWIYYPGHVESLTVTYETGETWTNSRMFPQTLYTIDVNPEDNVNAGVWFWIENDHIHALNTLVKIIWTLAILNIGRLKHAKT